MPQVKPLLRYGLAQGIVNAVLKRPGHFGKMKNIARCKDNAAKKNGLIRNIRPK